MDGDIIPKRVFGWAIFWYTTYRFAKRFHSTKCPEYSCRIITEIHAIIITVLTCKLLFFSGTWPFDMLGLENKRVEIETICASLGYFLHDFLWCLYHMTEGPAMLFHHFVSIITMSFSLWTGVSAVEVMGTIFGSEISSIFLNLRWFLKFHKKDETLSGMAADILFVTTFIGVRIFIGGCLAYSELLSPAPLPMKIGGACMYAVNLVFLFHIISFSRYKIKKYLKKGKSSGTGMKHAANQLERNGHAHGDAPNGLRKRANGHSTGKIKSN